MDVTVEEKMRNNNKSNEIKRPSKETAQDQIKWQKLVIREEYVTSK
ncbi:hypothetical protein [Alteribacillus sp. YIM 98480]|nr:hypothetical protein [Alteribacillus sp. YIM 98480]